MLVLTSWDDGHPSDLRLAELLAQYGLKGTFFVPVENSEGRAVMTTTELRKLDQGFEIGGHSLTHRYLSGEIGESVLSREIGDGKRLLEDVLGHEVVGFCYPGGRFDRVVVRAVQARGFQYARTIENLRFELGKDRWRIPTTFQFYPHDASVLLKNVLRYPAPTKIGPVVRRMAEKDFFAYLLQSAERCAQAGGIFHLWGHSWEIEEEQLWTKLDTFFRSLASLMTRSVTLTEAVRSEGLNVACV